MKLKNTHVKNFKSIKDSTEFKIDEKVTCLVGKNESGKTALLQAMTKLNSIDPSIADFDDLEYPRHQLNEYQESPNYADALFTKWSLGPQDVAELEQIIGPTAQQIQDVEVSKGYSNRVSYSFNLDEHAVIEYLLHHHELTTEERQNLKDAQDVKILHKQVSELENPSQHQMGLLETIASNFGQLSAKERIIKILQDRLPKIAYFSEYLRMPGQVSVNDIKERQANNTLEGKHKIFLALLDMVGRSIADLEKITEHERLRADLEGASNRLTREIFRYWTQNRHLRVQFLFEQAMPGDPPPFNQGWIVRTRIENTRHGVTTSFDQRSAGFVWFFSFLIWFSQVRKQYGEKLVILLDEPGLSLHAKAQADLLRYIEERLAPTYQVIYTTHSPFMIDPSNLLRARTVEDVFIEPKDDSSILEDGDLGTKVGDDVLSTDKDTIFPLQACLGYELSQTLFVGEHTLLVEGPSEILYFEWFRRKLASLGRTALDRRWTITPCGGIDKVPAFLSLFAGNKLHIAIVTDLASGHKKKIRDLRESKLLRQGHVLTMDMYTGQDEADIEDLIGRTPYIELVKQAYSLSAQHSLPGPRPADAPTRVVKEVEEHFRVLPPEVDEFDHYGPSEYLIQQGMGFTLPDLDQTLDRFEVLFRDLNAMLQ
jgi:predicted ATP-dependent endonuclease of OLD family